ncbi:N-formylglutamate amidohydrolase [Aureimonas sp. OT7]|uniref:N-formylglutamate amidohydrolase n=1 Tax=Aureimonas sp. OT7 TaxID=2816454 RepID=UPI001781ECBE|nr:N-formylglutamate amidohydrolase [Aureimonas sp. OT7]QOG08666.1 N-formylglutamate amidohydrolase [Aureimonas sp. OT7]
MTITANDVPYFETSAGPCPAFEVLGPSRQTVPLVFCSPHSGRAYPADFIALSRLKGDAVRRSEDLFVDRLFDFVPEIGAPLLVARFPRAYLDLNREPYELDPAMFDGALPAHVNAVSPRVAGGLGTIPRIVAERQEIYNGRLSAAEGLGRISRIYFPFHRQLEQLVEATVQRFGMAVLVDCHSMPSSVRPLPGNRRPDMVVGDRFGTSADARYVAAAIAELRGLGYDVVRNKPYAGGYITEHYGRPRNNVHAIQIEISRGLYADEAAFAPSDGFAPMHENLRRFVEAFAGDLAAEASRPAAAE